MKISIWVLHWVPRILCIVAIFFVSWFLIESFGPASTILNRFGGFIIHLVPSFILILCLFLAWYKEYMGGVIFICLGIVLSPFLFMDNYRNNNSFWVSISVLLLISVPFILVGILFIMSHLRKKHASMQADLPQEEPESDDL